MQDAVDGDVDAGMGDPVLFPYAAGPAYVRALLEHGGQPALDASFRDPPTTTRQVLHPGRDAGTTLPPDRRPAGGLPAGQVVDRGVLGEAGLARLLGLDPLADGPQAGWSLDRFATVCETGRTCTYDDIVVMTAADGASMLAALHAWARDQASRDVITTGPTSLRLRSCSTGS